MSLDLAEKKELGKSILCQLSGGMDSAAVFVKLVKDGYTVIPVFINYDQSCVKQERTAATYISQLFSSTLMEVRCPLHTELSTPYVPVRNLVLGSLCSNIAISMGITRIAVGSKNADRFNDGKKSFFSLFNRLLKEGTEYGTNLEFIMPMANETKTEVISYLLKNEVDIQRLWSCYEANIDSCGKCAHCLEIARSLKEIGV